METERQRKLEIESAAGLSLMVVRGQRSLYYYLSWVGRRRRLFAYFLLAVLFNLA
jgi:hypothetical protein